MHAQFAMPLVSWVVSLVVTFLPAGAQVADALCDPGLHGSAADPFAYKVRGDRCEGTYVQDLESALLRVVSFTGSYEAFKSSDSEALSLEWQALDGPLIRLRAQSLQSRLYYRMDTKQPARPGSYVWATTLLGALKIESSDLGVLGWRRETVGTRERDVYLPVHIRQRSAAKPVTAYRLAVIPGRELAEMYISIWRVSPDGARIDRLTSSKAVGHGYYPAGTAIDVDIPRPNHVGLFYLELGATVRGGGAGSVEFWFR